MGVKISSLTNKTPLDGTEQLEINDGGTTKKTTAQDIADLGGGGGGAVDSVFGRTGVIVAATNDYSASQVQNTPAGTIVATTVQDAINELDSEKQAALGFTPENVANKATDFSTINDTKYPTVQAVQTEIIARVAGLAWKAQVTCATTSNITLSGEQTIDGVATSSSRVLVKNQSTASQNGIYVSAAGAWARAADADTGTELQNAVVPVAQGTSNADTTWNQTSDGITIGVTSIVFGPFGTSAPDASSTVKGIAKLYPSTSLGTNTDGAPDQNAVKSYVDTAVAGVTIPDATSSVKGKAKLYTGTGSNTDGSMDQNSATNAFQANDATLTALAGLATGANKIPYSTGTDTFSQLDLDTDGTLAANSDTKIASQKASKTYIDTKFASGSIGNLLYMYNNFS